MTSLSHATARVILGASDIGADEGGQAEGDRSRRTGRRIAAAQFATPCGFGPEAFIALLRNEHNLASRIGSRVLRGARAR